MTPKEAKKLAWEYDELVEHVRKLEALKSWTKKTAPTTYFKISCVLPDGSSSTRAELGETPKQLLSEFITILLSSKKKRMKEIEKLFASVRE